MTNKLVRGTFILSVATLFTKVIGSLFWMPFQNIAGDETVGLYRISFPFYTILLMIASAGIPVTVSKFVAERLAGGDWTGARRVLKAAALTLTLSGLAAFCLLFFGSELIADVLLENPPTESSLKVLAFAILVVPLMAVYRGYFQGHQQMMPTGVSQVVEQVIRVGAVIGLTWWMVGEGFSREMVAAGATSGAFFGALGGLAVVLWYNRRDLAENRNRPISTETGGEPLLPLAGRILRFAIPISLASLVLPLIGLVDSFTVPRLLMDLGHDESATNTLFGIYSRGEPFVNVISTFSSALTLALIPAISAHIARQEWKAVEHKIGQSWLMTLVVSLPSALILVILAQPLNIMMYQDDKGTETLSVLAFSAIFSTLAVTSSGILQGLGYNKIPVRHLLIGAAVKTAGNFLFIPKMGIAGSALAMVAAYLVVCVLNMWTVIRKTGVRIDWIRQIVKPVVSSLVMSVILLAAWDLARGWIPASESPRLASTAVSAALSLFAGLVYFLTLILTRTIGEAELRLLPMGARIIGILKRLGLIRTSKTGLTQ